MKKIIKRILLGIIVGVVLLLFLSKVNHEIRLNHESEELQKIETSEMIETNDGIVHADIKEASYAEDTIVFLHGLGMGDTTIAGKPMLMPFEGKHNLFIMDRFGNGLSDDTSEAQTVEKIVELYRDALEKTGQKKPYILIAHSISGIYATYWAQLYPEEIKAIIFLDADPLEYYTQEGEIDKLSLLVGKCEYLLADTGLQRFFVSDETLLGQAENQAFTEDENRWRKYLMYHNTFSKATYSEMKLYYENAQMVLSRNTKLTIPQLYIEANDVQGKYYDDIYASVLAERYDGDEKKIKEKRMARIQILEEKKEYMKKRGNIEIVELSGPHSIYEYDPEGVADTIENFLEKVQKHEKLQEG